LKIDLQLDNKQLTAKISVENSHVKHYLNHNLSSLKSGLLKQGFNPDNISIETDSQGFDMQDESFSDQQQGSSNGRQEDDYNFSPEQFSALKSELLEEMDGEIWEEGNIVKKINYWRGMNYVYHRMDLFA